MSIQVSRFWDGAPIPEEYEQFAVDWEKLNPDFVVRTYDLSWLESEDAAQVFNACPRLREVFADLDRRDDGRLGIEYFVQVADVIGYMMVWRYGGIYTNCDMQPVNPFPQSMRPDDAWASYENNEDGRIVNAIIGAPRPRELFWGALLGALPDRYFSTPGEEMVIQTGPGFLTDFANDMSLHVFPTETFNSVHWKQIAPGGDASPWVDGREFPENVIAVHHWGHKKSSRSNRIEDHS